MPGRTDTELWAIATTILTAKQLEAARLVWQRGISTRTAAHMLNISRSALTSRLAEARRRLADYLKQEAA